MNKQGTYISAAVGHMVDCYEMLAMKNRHPRSLTKLRQILGLRKRHGSKIFLETGTYLGNTAMRASWFFDKVITVEIDEDLYDKARRYLKKRKNIECLKGDAIEALPIVLSREDVQRTVIFLDGHFSGGITGKGQEIEPACTAIEILANYIDKIDGLIIDDFRTFTGFGGIPRKSDLFMSIENVFGQDFQIDVRNDQVIVEKILSV